MLGQMYDASDVTKMRIERVEKRARRHFQSVDAKPRAQLSVTAVLNAVLGVLR